VLFIFPQIHFPHNRIYESCMRNESVVCMQWLEVIVQLQILKYTWSHGITILTQMFGSHEMSYTSFAATERRSAVLDCLVMNTHSCHLEFLSYMGFQDNWQNARLSQNFNTIVETFSVWISAWSVIPWNCLSTLEDLFNNDQHDAVFFLNLCFE